jgi:glycosyltransferase involved in cell wall biosynthesis
MTEDLRRFNFSGRDVVYFNSAQVVELAAILRYLVSLPVSSRPTFFVEFFLTPGVTVQVEKKEVLTVVDKDVFLDPRAAFYRMVGVYWSRLAERLPIHCITFDQYASQVFAKLIGQTVSTFPLPRVSITNRRSRVGANPPIVGIIGHQRLDKGYHLAPLIIGYVLAARPSVRFLVHNGAPRGMEEVQSELRAIADREQRLELDERVADDVIWKELLERCDLIVCPYDANRFRSSYSAVASEAAAEAIPTVVPTDTSLSEMIAALNGGYTTFDSWDVRSISEATIEAIDRLDVLAENANAAAARWSSQQGPDRLIETILNTLE